MADLPSAQIKCNGRRLNPKAVVSAMPVVMAKARAQIIFFMALVLLELPEQCKKIRDRHHVLEQKRGNEFDQDCASRSQYCGQATGLSGPVRHLSTCRECFLDFAKNTTDITTTLASS